MTHSPLDQFKVKKVVELNLFDYDISLTNSAIFMILAATFILLYFFIAFRNKRLIPTRLQLSSELVYGLITDMLQQNVGEKGRKFVPLIFTLFLFIMTCNISIEVRRCLKKIDPYEPDNLMLVAIFDNKIDEDQLLMFYSWIMSANSSVSNFEHSVYEIIPKDCISLQKKDSNNISKNG